MMNRDLKIRSLFVFAAAGLLLVAAACAPGREPERRWQRRPRPLATPWRPPASSLPRLTPAPLWPLELPILSPEGTPSPPTLAPTPNRRGMHDRTRDPLGWSISAHTPPHAAAAMRLVDRARAELQAGTTGHAFDLLDEAIRADPGCVPAYVARAQASLLVGSTGGARADLKRAAAAQPRGAWLAEVVAVGGEVYETEGRSDVAIAAYRRALVIHPANRTARKALSRLLAR
ncbi:MAG: hypothetical protein VCC00_14170 [Deltaproteobacteria bacterium]